MGGGVEHGPPTAETRRWMTDGTGYFLAHLDRLVDAGRMEVTDPVAALPGWSYGHLLAHVALNAEALQRLAHWARTGVETPMYSSPEARDADIARASARPFPEQIAHVRQSAADLAAALDAVTGTGWDRRVRTAQGRDVPAREIVWMRTREVWIHAVDLDPTTVRFSDFPPDLLDALITDVLAMFARRGEAPGLGVEERESGRHWPADQPTISGGVTVRGELADLAAWLTGRSSAHAFTTSDGSPVPELPAWL